jgi:hypothetical protein
MPGEILWVDVFSAIVATIWHKQNLSQDRLRVEIIPVIPLRESEVTLMLQPLTKRDRAVRCGRKYELTPRPRPCLRF